jgi:hypothetical protein
MLNMVNIRAEIPHVQLAHPSLFEKFSFRSQGLLALA